MGSTAAQDEFNALMSAARDRTTSHPEDDSRFTSSTLIDSDSEDDSKSDKDSHSSPPLAVRQRPSQSKTPSANYILPKSNLHGNTGVKGVIADARDYDAAQRLERENRRLSSAMSDLDVSQAQFPSDRASRAPLMGMSRSKPRHEPETVDEESESDYEREDDEYSGLESDVDFWKKWQVDNHKKSILYHSAIENRSFVRCRNLGLGSIEAVDEFTFLDIIESTDYSKVFVYIHHPRKEISSKLAKALDSIASDSSSSYTGTKFIMLDYDEAKMEEDDKPSLLVFESGEALNSFPDLPGWVKDKPGDKMNLKDRLVHLLRR
jgi:hypothetical protein